MRLPDRLTGLFVGALGVLVVYGGWWLPPIPGQQVGPSVFPVLIGVSLLVSGTLIVAGFGRRFEEQAEAALVAPEEAEAAPREARGRLAGLRTVVPPALLLLYAVAADTLGFVLTAGVMVLVASLVLGARLRLALPLAVLAPIGAQLLFGELLGVALSPGPLPLPW